MTLGPVLVWVCCACDHVHRSEPSPYCEGPDCGRYRSTVPAALIPLAQPESENGT